MIKINSLTEEQKAKFPEYVSKWMKIGLSTEKADHVIAEQALINCYKIAGLTPPQQIIWTTSPLAGCVLVGILKNEKLMKKIFQDLKKIKIKSKPLNAGASVRDSVGVSVRDSVGVSVRDSVGVSVWDSVGVSVWDSVGVSVRDSVWDSVGVSVWASVGASVWDSVGDSVWDSVWDSVGVSVRDSVWDSVKEVYQQNIYWYSYLGQFDAGALGFFEYFREVCNLIEETEKAIPLWDLSNHSSWVYPYQNIAVISEKPTKIAVNEAGKIHCEDGPCISYVDGFEVYGLNGVRVSKELVETPADKLPAQLVLKEKNAEVRREIVRKIGTEKLCIDLNAKCVDKMDDYELLMLDLKDGRTRPYLKMLNPSIGTHHIEGVHPDCDTVKKALAWRNQTKTYTEPKVLT